MISLFDIEPDYGELIERVYLSALRRLGLDDVFDVDVSFVDEERIKEINRETRDTDRVTDVLSFPNIDVKYPFHIEDYPYDVDRETGRIMLGDIIICKKRMLEQAEEYGHSDARECAFLTLPSFWVRPYRRRRQEEDARCRGRHSSQHEYYERLGASRRRIYV